MHQVQYLEQITLSSADKNHQQWVSVRERFYCIKTVFYNQFNTTITAVYRWVVQGILIRRGGIQALVEENVVFNTLLHLLTTTFHRYLNTLYKPWEKIWNIVLLKYFLFRNMYEIVKKMYINGLKEHHLCTNIIYVGNLW